MADKDNIAKDVTTVAQLQEQLQISAKEAGICVVDAYSTKWGPCRAIAPTFRRLYLEADEATKLKFVSADMTTIIADHAQLEAAGIHSKPSKKDMPDTFPEFWIPLLKKQEGRAKPIFFFFKEGKLLNTIEGCQTPQIINFLKDLTTVKQPADEFLSGPLLEFWTEHFNPNDAEVFWEKFLLGLNVACKLTVPLDDAEQATLREALHVKPDRILVVHADNLNKWVGESTLMQAFTALLPGYEERAIQARLEKEKAQRQAEKEARQKAIEEGNLDAVGESSAEIRETGEGEGAAPAEEAAAAGEETRAEGS